MTRTFSGRSIRAALGCAVSVTAITIPTKAVAFDLDGDAESPGDVVSEPSVAEQLKLMRAEISAQREMIKVQNETIARQQAAIETLLNRTSGDFDLAQLRGTGIDQMPASAYLDSTDPLPGAPVGEAPPPEPAVEAMVAAVPEGQGVLTPKGRLTLDTSFEYTNSSANRLVFRGFELIPGLQVGLIEASDVDRDALVGTVALRYGITDRLEIEGRMPVMYRHDRIKVTQLRDEGIVRTLKLEESDIGDAEIALRYQVNAPTEQNRMIGIASLRVKSATGKSPFDVGFDSFGVATGLPTGSGFWGIQPGLSFLLPSDPVVIYGGMSFLYHLPKNVDRIVGDVLVGRVNPGDAASANIGFGFALNPRFSFSLGYNHTYIFPTEQIIGGTKQRSTHLQSGTFAFGMSYRLNERQSINFGLQLGATADAPGMSVVLRLPITF
ncbi:transporter [Sphingorhabdus pulchriflava]|uniref:Transporter n=1 Tax=Sphingorhabdus pulchriflava TaxID=2292257 RepID=A0A371BI69_9SPHN|nr:transporter [Sphingorhabdus pulchriflava]RDV07228.1 transporter [Sphingorhabdus pulchriflava]